MKCTKRRLGATLATAAGVLLALTPGVAHADTVATPYVMRESFWAHYSGDECLAESVNEQSYPGKGVPDNTLGWDVFSAGATNGGTISVGASVNYYLGLSATYNTNPDCKDAFSQPAGAYYVDATNYVYRPYVGWEACELTNGWWSNPVPSWGYEVVGTGACGAGYYETVGWTLGILNGAFAYYGANGSVFAVANGSSPYYLYTEDSPVTVAGPRNAATALTEKPTSAVPTSGSVPIASSTGAPLTNSAGKEITHQVTMPALPKLEPMAKMAAGAGSKLAVSQMPSLSDSQKRADYGG
jgi:hypothetical protein